VDPSATLRRVTRPGTPLPPGWFITFEGPEGAGKTTQLDRAAASLAGRGFDVLVTREPGGTWLGEQLREVLLARTGANAPTDATTDAILFNAARRQLVTEVIRPALAGGTIVLCARFADSTMAYQGFGAGVPLEQLALLESIATDGLRPDLTILLDVPPEVGLQRKSPGEFTRFEAEFDLDFHRRVRAGFLAIAAAEPARFAILDATAQQDAVAAAIREILDQQVTGRAGASEPDPEPLRTTP
jgi:dTMP kinase